MDKRNVQDIYELSALQEGILFHTLHDPSSGAYFEQARITITGELDVTLYEQSWNHLIQRHDILRTRFLHKKVAQPLQMVLKQDPLKVHYQSLMDIESAEQQTRIQAYLHQDQEKRFDLSRDQLVRLALLQTAPDRYEVIWSFHHILIDGWCQAILQDEFQHLYRALLHQQPIDLPPAMPFNRYIRWLREQDTTQATAYWQRYLKGYTQAASLLPEATTPEAGFDVQRMQLVLEQTETNALETMARTHKVSLNLLVQAIWALLLARSSQLSDVVFAATVSGRPEDIPGIEHMVGLFINAIPVRARLEDVSFTEFLTRFSAEATATKAYHYSSLADTQASSELKQDLINHILVFENYPPETGQIDQLPFAVEHYQHEDHSNYDLTVQIMPGQTLLFNFIYNARVYDTAQLTQITHDLQDLITQISTPRQAALPLKSLAPVNQHPSLPLLVTASFTAEPLLDSLEQWGSWFDMPLAVRFAPYNQIFQQLLDQHSEFNTHQGANLLLVRFEDWIRDINADNVAEYEQVLQTNYARLSQLVTQYNRPAMLFIGLLPTDSAQNTSPALQQAYQLIEQLNQQWRDLIQQSPYLNLVDCTTLSSEYTLTQIFDPQQDKLGHIPFADGYFAAMGALVTRHLLAWQKPLFKVIALDCDNTLWRGVCGEEQVQNLTIDQSYQAVQQFMLDRYAEGFLLVLCSKNSEADVWAVFDQHPDMLLKREHIVAQRINWQPKSHNIRDLAQQLNLGIDSFIFVDDSGVECTEVMQNAPEVLTLHIPTEEQLGPAYLQHAWAFDKFKVTTEDRQRTALYQAEQQRQTYQDNQTAQLGDFLRELNVQIHMQPMADAQLTRMSQLTQRTNQFNLSTIRRSEQDLLALEKSPEYTLWSIEVEDTFGQYGQVGLIISQQVGKQLYLDTFLLSCRVLGRNVEEAILLGLKRYAHDVSLTDGLTAEFRPTDRNQPILDFMERTGWALQEKRDTGHLYHLAFANIADTLDAATLHFSMQKPALATESAPTQQQTTPSITQATPVSAQNTQKADWTVTLVNADTLKHRAYYEPLQRTTEQALLKFTQQTMVNQRSDTTPYVPATSIGQQRMQTLWQQILGVDDIGIRDEFIALGGHSLKATRLVAAVEREFATELSLYDFFKFPTIEGLCTFIEQGDESDAMIDYHAEIVLPDDIQPASAGPISNKVDNILLTGATGFLGIFVLHELLKQTEAQIHCLVRANDHATGYQRLQSKLADYQLWDDIYAKRLSVVIGELDQPKLGLSADKFAQLAAQIDVIYHNGALVNFVYAYPNLKAPNVSGTVEIIRLACTNKLKPLHFTSTIGVFSPHAYTNATVIQEEQPLEHPEALHNGYAESKWVAEKIVELAKSRGLPAVIYRPGEISGHSQTGVFNTDDFFSHILKGCLQLGTAPNLETSVEMVPVDYVSQALVHLSLQYDFTQATAQVYHLVNPNSVLIKDLLHWMQTDGYHVKQVPYAEWREVLIQSINANQDNAIKPLLHFFAEENPFSSEFSLTFSNENTINNLADSGIQCPEINDAILNRYFSYYRQSGFLPPIE